MLFLCICNLIKEYYNVHTIVDALYYLKMIKKRKNMILNIAICDDSLEDLEAIKEELYRSSGKLGIEIETYLYTDGSKIADLLLSSKIDIHILFLDIDMPNISGLEVAKKIRGKESDIILIFISAHEQYVFESIDYNPFKYIRKAKMREEIEIALKKAYSRVLVESDKKYIVKTQEGEVRLYNADIMYFEMISRKINCITNDGLRRIMMGRKNMTELINELNDENFVKIHSGCIVNVKYINEYSGHDITLDNGQKLIVSRSRIKEVKEEISKYWGKRI